MHRTAPDDLNGTWTSRYGVFLASAGVIVVFGMLVLGAVAGIDVLRGVRGYVLGEGQWGKAQKRAVVALYRYARSGNDQRLADFRDAVAVTRADRDARLQLLSADPDAALVRQGFANGGIPVELVPAMSRLVRWGRGMEAIQRPLSIWQAGDESMEELVAAAEELHRAVEAVPADAGRVDEVLQRIAGIDERLTLLENDFSRAFSDSALQVERALTLLLLVMGALVVLSAAMALQVAARSRQRHERVLAGSEARYRRLFEQNVLGACLVAPDGTVLEVNHAFADMLGYAEPAEMAGVPAGSFNVDPDHLERMGSGLARDGRVPPTEVQMRRKDGEPRWLLATSIVLEGDGDTSGSSLTMALDITERKELERELGRARRMEAMGQIAGSVAHDFNNLLTVIQGNATLILEETIRRGAKDAYETELLREIAGGAEAAAALTGQLLEFSKGQAPDLQSADVNGVVERLRGLLRRLLPPDVACHMELQPDLPRAEISRTHLDQVVLNLAVNARDAIGTRGELRISTYTVRPVNDDGPGQVCIRIEDDGSGMDAATRDRAFEPFFTTKPAHTGTGMGLATVYGIVSRCGGSIELDTAPGEGTTFRIFLPAAVPEPLGFHEAVADGAPADSATESPDDGEGGLVLLVEDTVQVRDLARRVLEREGFEIVEAEDGGRALSALERIQRRPDLIVSDVLMVGMDGPEMMRRVREQHGDVPVIFMSGFTDNALVEQELRRPDTYFLSKPFMASDLRSAARRAMEA